jgi:nitric oxide dioxygenase
MSVISRHARLDQTAIPVHQELERTDVHEIAELSEQTRSLVKATAPLLAARGEELTVCMYRRMFSENPELKAYFNQAHQATSKQPRSLAAAVHAVAAHIDQLAVLEPAVQRIAHRHASLDVRPEHYPIVGKHLLKAMQEVLGAAATPEVLSAWAETYMLLSSIFIGAEQTIYTDNAMAPGGWIGFRRFRVVHKVPECETMASFYLQPVDRKPLPPFQPGQYLTLKFDQLGPDGARRNYSLSDAPCASHYRVTIKRELLAPGAARELAVSHHMHDAIAPGDEIEVGPPCGDFVLRAQTRRPIVLLSAGVGLTPLVSMYRHLASQRHEGPVYFIHGTQSRATHALHDEIRDIATRLDTFHAHVCYSAPTPSCVQGLDYHTRGRLDGSVLERVVPGLDCEFYFLGPVSFMRAIRRALLDRGVPEARLHFEFFGPAEELE